MSDDKADRIRQFVHERICLLKKLAEIDMELESNRLKLLTLLTQVAVEQARALTLLEFVSLARKAGFVTQARCYSGLIYAAIRKLVFLGVLEREEPTHGYRYVSQPVGP
jgi:hypothetical protein